MVIYWYGYVEGLQAIDNVLVCDKFPSDWVFPTGERAESAAELSFDADIYTSSTLSATTCGDEYRLFGPTSRSLSSRVLSK
jgi:hypothetical protein